MKNNRGIDVITLGSTKFMSSKKSHYIFDKEDGTMMTWGKTHEEDAELFPAPTILDMEISTGCNGVPKGDCHKYCYKLGPKAPKENMSFEIFKYILDSMDRSLTQIAFGSGATGIENPEIWEMMDYARKNGVIPNITIAHISDDTADKLVERVGACAVSYHGNFEVMADSIYKLTSRGLKQVNIHLVIYEENYEECIDVLSKVSKDERCKDINAVVFLSLKQKGLGEGVNVLSQENFDSLVSFAKHLQLGYGFDSCSSKKYYESLSDKEYEIMKDYIMPCESTLESSYINVRGDFFPCSFTEGTPGWETGISAVGGNFVKDVWNHPDTKVFRKKLLETKSYNRFNCRECPIYKI